MLQVDNGMFDLIFESEDNNSKYKKESEKA